MPEKMLKKWSDRKGVHYASWLDYETFKVRPPVACPFCKSASIASAQSFVLYYPPGFKERFFWFCPVCRKEWEAEHA